MLASACVNQLQFVTSSHGSSLTNVEDRQADPAQQSARSTGAPWCTLQPVDCAECSTDNACRSPAPIPILLWQQHQLSTSSSMLIVQAAQLQQSHLCQGSYLPLQRCDHCFGMLEIIGVPVSDQISICRLHTDQNCGLCACQSHTQHCLNGTYRQSFCWESFVSLCGHSKHV